MLRLLISLCILLAMLRPTLVHSEIVRQSATLIVLADRSRSMQVADAAGKNALGSSGSTLETALPQLRDRCAEDFDVKLYTFDAELHPVELSADDPLDLGDARRPADRHGRPARRRCCGAKPASGWPA